MHEVYRLNSSEALICFMTTLIQAFAVLRHHHSLHAESVDQRQLVVKNEIKVSLAFKLQCNSYTFSPSSFKVQPQLKHNGLPPESSSEEERFHKQATT